MPHTHTHRDKLVFHFLNCRSLLKKLTTSNNKLFRSFRRWNHFKASVFSKRVQNYFGMDYLTKQAFLIICVLINNIKLFPYKTQYVKTIKFLTHYDNLCVSKLSYVVQKSHFLQFSKFFELNWSGSWFKDGFLWIEENYFVIFNYLEYWDFFKSKHWKKTKLISLT